MPRKPLLQFSALTLLFSMLHSALQAQDTARSAATLKTATVYFGYGAELTHTTSLKVNAQTRFIVISQLSTTVDLNSLQISVPENMALLSHRFNVVYPESIPVAQSREAKMKEDSVTVLLKEIARLDNLINIEQETLSKTGTLIETAVNTSGNKSISSDELLKLVNFYNTKINAAKMRMYDLREQNAASVKTVEGIRTRIGQLVSNADPSKGAAGKPYGELTLQVMCQQAADAAVAISYYTTNAGWTPLYDIRVNSKTNVVKLIYKASITQTTGIDWKKTKLTLSTGTPSFGVVAPILSPWTLQLFVPGLYTDLQRRAQGLSVTMNTVQSMNNDKALAESVVVGYGTVKKDEETVDPSSIQQYTTLNEGQLNTNFEIDLPYDIETDGELHQVTIKNEEVTCFLKNYAVPRIDKEAYLLAEVADWQQLDLLPGDANIIMDETYIGKTIIDPTTTADTLNLSLGRDRRLAVKRTLVKELSSLKTSGSTSRQVFTYELIVKNNKLTDINMLLKDQFPLSNIREIEVKLEDDGGAMVNTETGVMTWKLTLKPGESQKIRFTYSVKYPKDKKIINLK